MHNITLVCTRHEASGICNSLELHNVIEFIKPEIIFEELSQSHFDQFYQGTRRNLETNAIKLYLQDHIIEHIPVDTYRRSASYENDVDQIYDRIFSANTVDSFKLRYLTDKKHRLGNEHGFAYLNSEDNNQAFDETNIEIERLLTIQNDEDLVRILRLEKDVIEKREQVMLDNIYNYSKENPYNEAIFFIGSGHRKSVFCRIEEYKIQEKLKLNWITEL